MRAGVSIFLILVFGFSLVGEILKKSNYTALCQSSSSILVSGFNTVQAQDRQEQEKPFQKCDDSCRLGQGHFSHCPYLNAGFSLQYLYFESFVARFALEQFMAESPHIEVPRRPPRLISA